MEKKLDDKTICTIYYFVQNIIPERMKGTQLPNLRNRLNLKPGSFARILWRTPTNISNMARSPKPLNENFIFSMRGAVMDYLVLETLEEDRETPLDLQLELESRGAK